MMKRKVLILACVVVISGLLGYIGRASLYQGIMTLFYNRTREIHTTEIEFLSGNLRLRGTLYTPAVLPFQKYPVIVICHGGTPLGRNLALYVLLARGLAELGYGVLTFDFRGFGESEDPHRFETFSDLDFVQDVSSALNYLLNVNHVDPARFYVIGHSFGAGVAVAAGIRDIRIKKVVAIAPGRGTKERFFGENATNPGYPSRRMSHDMNIDPPIPRTIFDPHLKDYVAEAILDYPIHSPILLIDGENEFQEELTFLQAVYEQMTEPKKYVTIHEADHYFGTKRDQDGSANNLQYDQPVMNELLEVINTWFRD